MGDDAEPITSLRAACDGEVPSVPYRAGSMRRRPGIDESDEPPELAERWRDG